MRQNFVAIGLAKTQRFGKTLLVKHVGKHTLLYITVGVSINTMSKAQFSHMYPTFERKKEREHILYHSNSCSQNFSQRHTYTCAQRESLGSCSIGHSSKHLEQGAMWTEGNTRCPVLVCHAVPTSHLAGSHSLTSVPDVTINLRPLCD